MRRIDKHLGGHVLSSESQKPRRTVDIGPSGVIPVGACGRAGSAGCVPGRWALRESGNRMAWSRAVTAAVRRIAP